VSKGDAKIKPKQRQPQKKKRKKRKRKKLKTQNSEVMRFEPAQAEKERK